MLAVFFQIFLVSTVEWQDKKIKYILKLYNYVKVNAHSKAFLNA